MRLTSEHAPPPVERHVDERERLLDAGVVDEQIQAAESLPRLAERPDDVSLGGDVHRHGHRPPAGALDPIDHSLGLGGVAQVVDRDGRAVGGELVGDALADAGVRARDQRLAAAQQPCFLRDEPELWVRHRRIISMRGPGRSAA